MSVGGASAPQATATPVAELCATRRVIVCCGAGGVGKTTVATSLAIAAARLGRRALVITIDPSRRLAEALGMTGHPAAPVALADAWLRAAGIPPPGSLHAWLLDPQQVADDAVRRFAGPAAGELLANRLYRHVTGLVAGMQEYTAVQAMHGFLQDARYDLVVLDTPPSRNALRFLESPGRVAQLLDSRVLRFFMPAAEPSTHWVRTRVVHRVMDFALGEETRREATAFFALFARLFPRVNQEFGQLRDWFRQPEVAVLIVTSPEAAALTESRYLAGRTRDDLGLQLSGYLLNRCLAAGRERVWPGDELLAEEGVTPAALAKLRELAVRERDLRRTHRALLEALVREAGESAFVQALPLLPEGVSDLGGLVELTEACGVGGGRVG